MPLKVFVFFFILVVLILGLLFGMFFDRIQIAVEKRNHKKMVYKVLHYYAEENDVLLLNDVEYAIANDEGDKIKRIHVDHVLFGKKHIYLVKDVFAVGGMYGNLLDDYLFLKNEKMATVKYENPVKKNLQAVQQYYEMIATDPRTDVFSSVVVYNNSLFVPKPIVRENATNSFLPLKDLEKLIVACEDEEEYPVLDQDKVSNIAVGLKRRSDETKQLLKKEFAEKTKELEQEYNQN